MKKLFIFCVLVCGAMSLNSCLDFDEPGDELELDHKILPYEKPAPDDGGAAGTENGGQE